MSRVLIICAAAYLLDTQVVGIPVFGMIGCFALAAVNLFRALKSRLQGNDAISLLSRGVAGVLTIIAIFGTVLAGERLGRRGARKIIAASEAYRHEHGHYPGELQALVPGQLSSLPWSSLRLTSHGYTYRKHKGEDGKVEHTLMYVFIPPFGRIFYTLETKAWSGLD